MTSFVAVLCFSGLLIISTSEHATMLANASPRKPKVTTFSKSLSEEIFDVSKTQKICLLLQKNHRNHIPLILLYPSPGF